MRFCLNPRPCDFYQIQYDIINLNEYKRYSHSLKKWYIVKKTIAMIKLWSFRNPFKAELLLAKLQQSGIEAVTLNKKESVTQSMGRVEVHVPEHHYDSAKELLDNFQSEEE